LSESEQKSALKEANEKMKRMFGDSSDVFVPPYAYFNNETINALEELGIRILRASLFSGEDFDEDKSIFNQTKSEYAVKTKTEKVEVANIQKSVPEKEELYHLPGLVVVQFREYENESTIKVPSTE
jgi:peptidoglycan/xylan/chitin deacetylase (PgdA/CDA1 family)